MSVTTTIPAGLATGVHRNVFLTATFSEPLNRDTISTLTVLLVKNSDGSPVAGVADYIPATYTVTFQLSQMLDASTSYTWILVGNTEGILADDGSAALPGNERIQFTTGTTVDGTIPLAGDTLITGSITPFNGGGGVYSVVFGRTGEPISHVVTSAGQIGPSGTIVPAPQGAAVYLPVSEPADPIEFSGVIPSKDWLTVSELTNFTAVFTDNVDVVNLTNSGVTVLVENLLGADQSQPAITYSSSANTISFVPATVPLGSKWTVTYSSDIRGETAEKMLAPVTVIFYVRPTYFYSTVQLVRMNIQDAASKFPDLEIKKLIYENSLWAVQHAQTAWPAAQPPQYVKDYVLCKTKKDVIDALLMGSNAAISKRIGDVEFRYGSDISARFASKLEDLEACIESTKAQIVSSGTMMRTAVRAGNKTDRPGTAGTWQRLGPTGEFLNQDVT